VFAQDFTVFGGSLSAAYASKICKIMDLATKVGAPVIGLNDSGGARIQEGVESLAGYADIFPAQHFVLAASSRRSAASSAVRGRRGLLAGDHRLHSDGREDQLHVHHRSGSHPHRDPRDVTKEQLGGARSHASKSGVCHFVAPDDRACLAQTRELLGFLPSNNTEDPPLRPSDDPIDREVPELDSMVPSESNKPYDMKNVIRAVVDEGHLFEVHEHYARNMVIGFARIGGRPIGVVANQPAYLAGVLDIDASIKGARFVRFCDCFNLPIVTWVDVPGFLPGVDQEHRGIITHGAKLLYAFLRGHGAQAHRITRKAYGGAYDVMSSKHIRGDVNFAFPPPRSR
jgi:propionyl-CoA carboxylase beta chain